MTLICHSRQQAQRLPTPDERKRTVTTTVNPDPLMTLPEVAERLRRSPAQLRWMRHNGTGPRAAKISGRVMYRASDVEAWIDEQFEAPAKGA